MKYAPIQIQTVGDIASKNKGLLKEIFEPSKPQTLSPDLQRRTDLLIRTYGELGTFLTTMNPGVQERLGDRPDVCFFADYPTLAEVRNAYGTKAPVIWLVPQLINLSEYCGCREKFTDSQLEQCADVIVKTHWDLKVSELMLFFFRFKSSRYGRFYGTVDPMVVTSALWQFRAERDRAIAERIEAQERARREALARNPRVVSREQYDEQCIRQPFLKLIEAQRTPPAPRFHINEDWSRLCGKQKPLPLLMVYEKKFMKKSGNDFSHKCPRMGTSMVMNHGNKLS